MSKIKKKRRIAVSCLMGIVLFAGWMIWGNVTIGVRTISVTSERLPNVFSGYRIAHVSDLHNAEFGKENAPLLELLRDMDPDIIAITGDIVHSSEDGMEHAAAFIRNAAAIAPCYFVTGNHESWITKEEYMELEQIMVDAGVEILRDSRVMIEKDGKIIAAAGIDDPSFAADFEIKGIASSMDPVMIADAAPKDVFTILLSHRPEYFETYCEAGLDLVLAGHAHGGQFRLPFAGGLLAPHQGLFPEYDSGLYTKDSTNMIVSRGIGNSLFPIRFNNRPEVILVELKNIS